MTEDRWMGVRAFAQARSSQSQYFEACGPWKNQQARARAHGWPSPCRRALPLCPADRTLDLHLCLGSWHLRSFLPLILVPCLPSSGSYLLDHFPALRKQPSGQLQLSSKSASSETGGQTPAVPVVPFVPQLRVSSNHYSGTRLRLSLLEHSFILTIATLRDN